jgi:hypothetical protein
VDNFNLTPFFQRTSALKQDAANLLISLDFAGAGDWLGRWRGGSDGGIERRRWRWQGWAWATGGGSVICIHLPTQIWKNAFPYFFLTPLTSPSTT